MKYRPRSRNKDSNRHPHTMSMAEAIQEMLKESRWENKYNHTRILQAWPIIMGETVAKRTESLFIKNNVLFVKLTSAPLKSELISSKELIRLRILEMVEAEDLLTDIRFL